MTGYGLWLSTVGMKINDHRQTLMANNLANVDTPGFKHDLAVIRQREVESLESPQGMSFSHPVLDGLSGGVNVDPVFHSFAQGSLQHTGGPLDVAIEGEGFFHVSDGEESRFTRDGRFAVSPDGTLVMAAGNGRWRVLDDAGSEIAVRPNGGRVRVNQDGVIRQGDTALARLGVQTTDDLQTLRKVGNNTFRAEAEMRPVEARLVPETIEGSSFDMMTGLASMIEAQRSYQLNATMIRIQDELTGRAISTVGRVA